MRPAWTSGGSCPAVSDCGALAGRMALVYGSEGGGKLGCMAGPDWWLDPESAWSAKAARARQHLDSLRAEVDDFLRGGSCEVVPEQGSQPGETIYRLRMSQPIPIRFSTVI